MSSLPAGNWHVRSLSVDVSCERKRSSGDTSLSGTGEEPMLVRSARLLRRADFERVYKQGRRHFAAHMTVFYLRRASGAGVRVGFTVSRALGGAVERNRMKRRLREAVRLEAAPTVAADVVINPKKSLLIADFLQLRSEISRAFAAIVREAQNVPAKGEKNKL